VQLDGSIAIQTQPTPEEVARVLKNEPRDNTTETPWLNALLGTYAGVQLINSLVAFNLLQEGYGTRKHTQHMHAACSICIWCHSMLQGIHIMCSSCALQR
jgi:hypothetical protein